MGERPDIAGRVAWTYLATVLAGAVGGLLALIAYQVVNPLACPIIDAEEPDLALSCSLAWAIVLLLTGFAAAFAGALVLLKLGSGLAAWLGMIAGLVWLAVGSAGFGQWWWALLLALLPAGAALASLPWSPRSAPRQVVALAVALVAALGVLGWQLATG